MARKARIHFRHYSDDSKNEAVSYLIAKRGVEAYGLYCIVKEKLSEKANKMSEKSNSFLYDLSTSSFLKTSEVLDLLDEMVEFGLLQESNGVLSCEELEQNMSVSSRKKELNKKNYERIKSLKTMNSDSECTKSTKFSQNRGIKQSELPVSDTESTNKASEIEFAEQNILYNIYNNNTIESNSNTIGTNSSSDLLNTKRKNIKKEKVQRGNSAEESEKLKFAKAVIDDLNLTLGTNFRPETYAGNINQRRIEYNATLEDFKAIHRKKYAEWMFTDFEKYLRPSTLYRKEKFPEYLNQRESKTYPAEVMLLFKVLSPEFDKLFRPLPILFSGPLADEAFLMISNLSKFEPFLRKKEAGDTKGMLEVFSSCYERIRGKLGHPINGDRMVNRNNMTNGYYELEVNPDKAHWLE